MSKKNILIGITGSIAAYKIIDLCNNLCKEGYNVKTMLTQSGEQFVTTLTLKTLTKNAVFTDSYEKKLEEITHIDLATWADIVLLAPLSANTMAKIANGLADNTVTSTILALSKKKKVLIAPAMNTNMWKNKITQNNLSKIMKTLKNFVLIPPRESTLACNTIGIGAMATLSDIKTTLLKHL